MEVSVSEEFRRSMTLSFTALALAVGARDSELGPLWEWMCAMEVPSHPQDVATHFRDSLRSYRMECQEG
jgi:hypothetical protein